LLSPGCAELKAIARQAEQEHDAGGIAFVAARLWDDMPESSRLAEEAVHLDPKLTWLYAVVPGQFSSGTQTDLWVRDLQKYDPQNALPYFIIAAKINSELFRTKRIIPRLHDEPSAWQNAMAAAFQSPKFDNYCSQLKALEHKVVLRYSFDDPSRRLDCRGVWRPNGDTPPHTRRPFWNPPRHSRPKASGKLHVKNIWLWRGLANCLVPGAASL
jgi:hypothetical protein